MVNSQHQRSTYKTRMLSPLDGKSKLAGGGRGATSGYGLRSRAGSEFLILLLAELSTSCPCQASVPNFWAASPETESEFAIEKSLKG